jgi:hypothetical protein
MTAHSFSRLVHIVGGVMWVGAGIFIAAFLLPSARAIGPAAGPMMRELTGVRKLPVYLQVVSVLTILSGAVLAWRDAGGMGVRWFQQGSGLVFGIGALLAITGAMIGLAVSSPTAKRIGALSAILGSAGRPPSLEEQRTLQGLQDRLYTVSGAIAVLLLLASAAMAGARYL